LVGNTPASDRAATKKFDAGPHTARVVGVLGRAVRWADLGDRGADRAGDPRPQAVRADDVPGADLDRRAGAVVAVDPHRPAVPVAAHAGHGDAGAHVGAGPCCGAGEDRVQHVPSRRDDEVDPGLVLDRPGHRLTTGVEGDLPDGRRTAVQDLIQQTPAAQLDNAAARDRMRRQGVAGE
jgi:hypothetical protein